MIVKEIILSVAASYFAFAGFAFVLFYLLDIPFLRRLKIQQRKPKLADYVREIGFSLSTIAIYAAIFYLIFETNLKNYSLLYFKKEQYPTWWYWVAFPLVILLFDAYFYFTHRLLHHPFLFKTVHIIHHRSSNPTPWSAFSFHPIEAMVLGVFKVLIIFCLPIMPIHLTVFFIHFVFIDVYGHLGFELIMKRITESPFASWWNTSVAHNMHHQYFKGNYGIYTLWWDKLFGTLRKDYDEKYEQVFKKDDTRLPLS